MMMMMMVVVVVVLVVLVVVLVVVVMMMMMMTDLRKVDDKVKFNNSDLFVQVLWPVQRTFLHNHIQ